VIVACGDRAERRTEQAQLGQEIARQFLGQRTDQVSSDAIYEGGSWLGETAGGEYGIELRTLGETRMVWLVRATGRDSAGDPLWEVADVLVVPRTRDDERLSFFGCTVDGRPDPEVLAIALVEDAQWLDDVRRAWRASTASGRIEEIPVEGVACENDSYGI
jgi:hypothetical protein